MKLPIETPEALKFHEHMYKLIAKDNVLKYCIFLIFFRFLPICAATIPPSYVIYTIYKHERMERPENHLRESAKSVDKNDTNPPS